MKIKLIYKVVIIVLIFTIPIGYFSLPHYKMTETDFVFANRSVYIKETRFTITCNDNPYFSSYNTRNNDGVFYHYIEGVEYKENCYSDYYIKLSSREIDRYIHNQDILVDDEFISLRNAKNYYIVSSDDFEKYISTYSLDFVVENEFKGLFIKID